MKFFCRGWNAGQLKLISIYTDGGCSGNPGPGGWAFVIVGTEDRRPENKEESVLVSESWGAERNTTNNRMELRAVIESLKACKSMNEAPGELTLYTDSQYVQKGISTWIKDWKKRGWKTSDKKPVKNQDLWLCLEELASMFSISWIWIKGHAGNKYNERCDELTQKAIASL